MVIQQLSPHIADLIAAGEVVERPASVVKELVENAIDAGASAVAVEIQGGGMTVIRVTDNGKGIAPAELPVAFLRHATSKLRTAEDLTAIGTLGFRGEALAAIAAVSRVDIFSREKGAGEGAFLSLEGGVPGTVESAGCPEGTTIVVRDLFFNTPARLKFMKSDSAESAAVAALLQQIALSHPEVSLKYLRDGKEELHTPGDSKLLSAIYAARGRDFAMSLTAVDGGGEDVRVRGFVTDPLAGRGTRAMQTFFCCGRMIKSQLLTAALEEAYANRQMKGRFPGCVLHIDLPLHAVDVNVHPAKTVVKFLKERVVFSAVHHTVSDALDASTPKPDKPEKPEISGKTEFFQTMDVKTFREQHRAAAHPITSPEMGGRVTFHDSGRVTPAPSRPVLPPESPAPKRRDPIRTALPQTIPQTIPSPVEDGRPVPTAKSVPAVAQLPDSPGVAEQLSIVPETVAPWRYVGEVLRTYIVAEDGDDVWLIDKHAAHERINFDRMKAQQEPFMRQQLLSSLAVDLAQEQYAVLLENLPLLEEFGFEAEDFGNGALVLRAIPADLETGQARETLEELADKLLLCRNADPAAARDTMLHTMACRASIKGGWQNDARELTTLLEKVSSGEVQFCPHGRPVKVKLSRYEIEKLFKRA